MSIQSEIGGRTGALGDAGSPTRTLRIDTQAALEHEITLLQGRLEHAEERARLAEEQLLRVHRAVRAVKKDARSARDARNEILEAAKRHASELVRQAQFEADRIVQGPASIGTSMYGDWSSPDPSLDERLDEYLQNEMEPDRSRGWMLGDRNR